MNMRKIENTPTRLAAVTAVVALALIAVTAKPAPAQGEDKVDPFAGLKKVGDAKVGIAYIDPDADFSVFKRVAIADPYVAFRANWRRDQNRNRLRPITTAEADRIRADVARLLKEVFTETLEADDGYEVTKVADYDVLLVKPAIVDLSINLPETGTAGASATLSASTGEAVLYIEFFDSVTGDILGRAADRQAASSPHFGLSTDAFQEGQARRIFQGWAEQLRAFLDEHYKE
jgi:hypothetical protein